MSNINAKDNDTEQTSDERQIRRLFFEYIFIKPKIKKVWNQKKDAGVHLKSS